MISGGGTSRSALSPARCERFGALGVPFELADLGMEGVEPFGQVRGGERVGLGVDPVEQVKLFFFKAVEFAHRLSPRMIQRFVAHFARFGKEP